MDRSGCGAEVREEYDEEYATSVLYPVSKISQTSVARYPSNLRSSQNRPSSQSGGKISESIQEASPTQDPITILNVRRVFEKDKSAHCGSSSLWRPTSQLNH